MKKYEKIIKERLSEKRYVHSLSVAKQAVKLAEIYGADKEKAKIAGLLHDITKEDPKEEQIKFIKDHGVNLTSIELCATKLLHSISGMIYLRDILKITDTDILNAVLYHTTARAGMSLLEQIIFVADFISDDRDYQGVDKIREKSEESLESAMIEGLAFTISDLVKKEYAISCNTVYAYNELIIKSKGMKNSELI